MKTCKFKLPDNHTGIAEIDGDDVILYIEKNSRVFFNLIVLSDRVTPFEVFTLTQFNSIDDKRLFKPSNVLVERVIHGRIGRWELQNVNIDTFDIRAELEHMYTTYAAEKKRREDWEKKLNNFTCI